MSNALGHDKNLQGFDGPKQIMLPFPKKRLDADFEKSKIVAVNFKRIKSHEEINRLMH